MVYIRSESGQPWETSALWISPDYIDGKDNVTLAGTGKDSVLKLPPSLDGPLLVIDRTSGFAVRDLVLDGGGKRGPLLEIRGPLVAGFLLENVIVRNVKGPAIRVSGADGRPAQPVQIQNVTVELSDSAGVAIEFAGAASSEHVVIAKCHFRGPFADGIRIAQPVNPLTVTESSFRLGTNGISLQAKDADWAGIHVEKNRFSSLDSDVASAVGPAALGQIQLVGNAVEAVKKPAAAQN